MNNTTMSQQNQDATLISNELMDQINALPTLVSQLPHEFQSGLTFKGTELRCSDCGTLFPDDHIRARLTPLGTDLAVIDGYCCCAQCSSASPFGLRVYGDGRTLFRTPNGWSEHQRKSPPLWFLPIALVLSVFSRLKSTLGFRPKA